MRWMYCVLLGIGIFICTVTTPWMFDSSRLSFNEGTWKNLVTLVGWWMVGFSLMHIYQVIFGRRGNG